MKAITLRPPWGWAVLNGKSPENRTRNIAGSYRGPLVIHQGKRPIPADDPPSPRGVPVNTLPIPLPHRVKIRKWGGIRPWCAECSCGTWGWRSRHWHLAMVMTEGHLTNQSGKDS